MMPKMPKTPMMPKMPKMPKTPRITYFDAHNDTLTKAVAAEDPVQYLLEGPGDVSLKQLIDLGAAGACFAAFTDGSLSPEDSHLAILKMAQVLQDACQRLQDHTEQEPGDGLGGGLGGGLGVRQLPQAILTLEGGYSFTEENWQERLKVYADLGVRLIAPVWNHSNCLAEGLLGHNAAGEVGPKGLTALGKQLIGALPRHGMRVDVSHMSPQSFWDTVALGTGPLVASHSAAMALKDHPRNLTDEQLSAIAASGGMVNVVFCRTFIGSPDTASAETVAAHMHYLASRWGTGFVGIGSDFDGATMPVDMQRISALPRLDQALRGLGYKGAARQAMLGGNLLGLLGACSSVPYNAGV